MARATDLRRPVRRTVRRGPAKKPLVVELLPTIGDAVVYVREGRSRGYTITAGRLHTMLARLQADLVIEERRRRRGVRRGTKL